MTTYAIHCQVKTHLTDRWGGEYSGSRGLPTFYLDSRVQGIVSKAHAVSIARDVINPLRLIPDTDLMISAYVADESECSHG